MSDQNTLDGPTHAQLIPCLEQAARIAQRRADRHAGREEWADAVQWSDLHGRIMQVVFDLPVDLATDAGPDRPAPTGSLIDLLQAAERLLRDPGDVEGDRRVRDDAGDQNAFAFENACHVCPFHRV